MKLTLPEKPDLVLLFGQIEDATADELKALLPRETNFWNVVVLKILQKQAEKVGKKITFVAQNEKGKTLLAALHGEDLRKGVGIATGGPLAGILSRLPRISLLGGGVAFWKIAAVGAVLLILLAGGGIFAALYFSKATVTLRLNTSSLVKNKEVVLSRSATEPDAENLSIPGIPIKVTESGTFEGDASGTKEVGSKAGGEVTIYNYDTTNEKEFSEGDVLVSSEGDLQFLLSEDISVDAATSTIDPDTLSKSIEPATNSVVVNAVQIGSSYNIEEGQTLCFEDLDDDLCDKNEDDAVFAETTEKFSGGESKEVSVVTAEDQDKVLEAGTKELSSRCEQSLSGKLVGDQKLAGKAVESAVLNKEYVPAVGEEADKVQLKLEVECQSLAYSEDALYQVLSEKLQDLVPEGFQQRREEADIQILTAEKSDEGIKIQARISAELTPQVDTEEIQSELTGRAFSDLETYFSTKKDVNSYEIDFWPPIIPNILGRFPLKKDRITVQVEEI